MHFYSEILDCICNEYRKTKLFKKSDTATQASIAALSVWATKELGIEEPVAVGLVTSVLIVISSAIKGEFCKMSKEELDKLLNPKQE